jgi:hypothetical protein
MYISKKHVSRRAVLKGMGVTMALPLLDAMVPASTVFAKTAAGASASKQRLVCMEMVHGSAGSTAFGVKKNLFAPVQVGRDFEWSPTCTTPKRSRCRKSAATTSARARCS